MQRKQFLPHLYDLFSEMSYRPAGLHAPDWDEGSWFRGVGEEVGLEVKGRWRGWGLGVLAVSVLQHEAVAQAPPNTAPASSQTTVAPAAPQTLPAVRVSAPKSAARQPPKRKPPLRAAINRPATPAVRPSGAPNIGSGPSSEAQTASQPQATGEELNARPVTRPGEILEATPGLIVTQHSGEGKANQYFLRGYNLDHGTDMAIWVDDVPINMRTHAHGQGYADLNWLMPETVNSLDIRKGPYFADEGDFGSAGNLHIGLIDSVPKAIAEVTAGSFGYERFFGMDSAKAGNGDLLIAGGLVGRRGVLATTVGGPGALRELQPAVVAVAGVDAPVTARLAGGDAIPFAVGSRGCVTGEGDATAADYCAGEGQFGDADS